MENNDLVSQVFTQQEANNIKKIYKDGDCNTLLLDVIAEKLINCKKIVTSQSLNQLVLICFLNKKIISDSEPITVASLLRFVLQKSDPFPSLNKHFGVDFAARTFVCTNLFIKGMEARTNRFSYPKPEYYKEVAKIRFIQNNMDYMAKNWNSWEYFFLEYF